MSVQIPNKFLADPEWYLVEEVVREALDNVSIVPDAKTAPTDFKAQVLAMIKMKKALEAFLVQASIIKQTETEKNPFV